LRQNQEKHSSENIKMKKKAPNVLLVKVTLTQTSFVFPCPTSVSSSKKTIFDRVKT
jgi:hypothetical protein